jgi:type IV secretion system protein VirB10
MAEEEKNYDQAQSNFQADGQAEESYPALEYEEYDPADVDNNVSSVAASPAGRAAIFIVMAIFLVVIVYYIFSSGEEAPTQTAEDIAAAQQVVSVAPVPQDLSSPIAEDISSNKNQADLLSLDVPTPPALSEQADVKFDDDFLSDLSDNNIPDATSDITPPAPVANKTELAPMIIIGGGGQEYNGDGSFIANTAADSAEATKLPYPSRTVAQGKLITAVLESAINTDFPGSVRAIVSRDVYAEEGRAILIPKGSRIIGAYAGSAKRGQNRVFITWGRLIRPDSIDIRIDSPGTDQFGRAGVQGFVDNKYLEIFNNSILLSMLTIGTAYALEESTSTDGVSETTRTDGSTTTSGKPSDFAAQEIIDTIGGTAQTVLEGLLNVSPTITVPHGTRIKVFVNKDLIFPDSVTTQDIRYIR